MSTTTRPKHRRNVEACMHVSCTGRHCNGQHRHPKPGDRDYRMQDTAARPVTR